MKEKQVQALSEHSSCSTAATVQVKSTATESSLNPEDGSDDDDHLIQKICFIKIQDETNFNFRNSMSNFLYYFLHKDQRD